MPAERAGTGQAAALQAGALQAQITALGERMDRGFSELKEILQGMDDRVRRLENNEAGCQPLVNSRLNEAWRQLDQHTNDIKALNDAFAKLKDTIAELQHANKILTWIGGILGSAVIVWLITQLLGLIK